MQQNTPNKPGNFINIEEVNIHKNPVIKWIFIILGLSSVALGVLGMFLPLLPTTIFFILAAWCFARSSEKFYIWLHSNRLFGKYLRNYRSGNGMTMNAKIFTIGFLWAGIGASAIWATDNLYVRILLFAIAVGVTWHLLAIKTYKENSD